MATAIGADTVTRAELARLAGVVKGSVTSACKTGGSLYPALASNGSDLLRNHQAVSDYIDRPRRKGAKRGGRHPKSRSNPTPPPDPFTIAAELAAKPDAACATVEAAGVSGTEPAAPASVESPVPTPAPASSDADHLVASLHWRNPGQLPDEIGDMTLRQVATEYRTIADFGDVIKALKNHADYVVKQQLAETRRGDLVKREIVTDTLLPLIDTAFRRLVTEAPKTLAQKLVARVLSGGDDLSRDVETMIRDSSSGILTDCKTTLASELVKLDDGSL